MTPPSEPSESRRPVAVLGERFSLDTGETVPVADTGLRVTYAELVEDSRCPPEATCVWEGDAVVRLTLDAAGEEPAEAVLHTYDQQPGAVSYGPYRVELTGVSRDGSRATFVVTR